MNIKSLILFFVSLLPLLFLQSNTTSAQNGNNNTKININVSAQVISTIEMITIQSMNLTKAKEINNVITIDPLNSSSAGKMIVVGNPGSDIRISYLEQHELTRKQGSETLQFNYRVAGNTEDDQSTAELLDHENRDFEFNEQGRFYLWIGGSVDISAASPGNYEGEFTVDIEYI